MTELYKVQRIIGKRIRDSKFIEYKVKWQGYPTSQSTWQPIKHLKTVRNLIQDFEARNKDKMPPTPVNNLKLEHKPSKFGSALQKKIEADKQIPKGNHRKNDDIKPEKRTINEESKSQPKAVTRSQQAHIKKNQNSHSQIDIEDQFVDKIIGVPNGDDKDDNILDGNLESIAMKILSAVDEKKKQPKIIGIIKKLPEQQILYQVEDGLGNQEYKTKEFVMAFMSKELIEFYESKIPFTEADK